MFAGHLGAALVIGRAEPRVNPGLFLFAALALDFALWLFVLLGWESVSIPADFVTTHQPAFVFPWSHGLLASVAWSVMGGAGVALLYPGLQGSRVRVALCVGLAVFSHWLLDALVHAPEMPLASDASHKVGLSLWNQMPLALAVEAVITVAGLGWYLAASGISRARKAGLVVLVLVALVSTVAGMTIAPAPPSVAAMAGSSLVTIVVVCVLAGWLGRRVS